MRLKNRLERLAQGEPLTSSMENGQLEFVDIDQGMYNISQSMMRISKENTTLNDAVEKKVRDIRNSRVRLGNELEFMYSLALLPMEMKGEEETGRILNKLNGILTQTIKYHISMVFLKEGNYYKYHSSRVKDMQIISTKLHEECRNYLIPVEIVNPNGKILFSPSTTVKPHFNKILDKLNLAGLYAQLPIPNIGLLVVGYIDQQGSFTKEELRRLQIVTNIIAFSIENLEAISVLKRSIKFRTTELETTNQLLMDTLQDKDNMIKLVSHDLKAPLRNVSGLVDSIYRKYSDSLDEDFLNRLERIKNNVQKEMQMIEEILTSFETLEKGDTVENLNVYAILESIQRDLQYDLGRKNIRFDLDKNLPKINSNPYIVEHVFLNLIDNAIKNFQDGDENSWIKISAFKSNSDVTFTVEDNGLGIPEDKQDEVFKAYTRGSEQYERDTSGFGLGLALTKSLVEKVGGKIEFESKVGKGTKFFITFKK
jgi:signal transduction histidine kinase